MSGRYDSARRSAVVAVAALAALVVQPLGAAPSYAGLSCDPVPLPGDDCTAPQTTITGHPDAPTQSRDATFTFEADEEGASFECSLDSSPFGSCGTPQSASGKTTASTSYAGLAYGNHTFAVRALDAALGTPNSDQTPATFSWTVDEPSGPDTDAPDTSITAGADRWWPSSFLGLTYTSTEPESGWQCTLNGEPKTCDSDQLELLHLTTGDYRFTVAAVDAAGNADPTPAEERWTVPMNDSKLETLSKEWEQKRGSGYFQDSYSVTSTRGAYIEQGKRGFRSLALVATKCPGCGKVAVYLKGDLLDTVNLAAPRTKKRQIIPIASWAKPHSGLVRLEVRTSGKDVLIEGLGFSALR